jgi:NhaP-type Na+/H+ or K+/H+ antiporter
VKKQLYPLMNLVVYGVGEVNAKTRLLYPGKELFILIHLLTVIGSTPGGSSTVHIYTQTIHETTQLTTDKTINKQKTQLSVAITKRKVSGSKSWPGRE